MNHALRVAGVVALTVFVLAPGAALAGITPVAPELDPSLSVAGLVLLVGTAAFVIERYRRRTQ
jgi:membrane protein implicated in regulation of membrane protease activity